MYVNKIAFWAKERGLKHNFLAKKIGVSVQTFSRWANNETQPDLLQAAELADLLGVSITDLYEKKPHSKE
jgi:putative transcriptional regulator